MEQDPRQVLSSQIRGHFHVLGAPTAAALNEGARLARALQAELHHWRTVAPVRRSERFADILIEHVHLPGVGRAEQRFAEFLLRLASDPASVGRWPEARSWLDLAFVSPVLV